MSENANSQELYLDENEALGRVMNNKKILCKLLNSFLARDNLAGLKPALDSGDYQTGAEISHALKGISANLALKALYENSKTLESNLKEKNEIDYDAAYKELEAVLDATISYVNNYIAVNQ
jgi:HPt (histidine-containing phosphotransfer) domain-containing protein